MIRVVLLFFSLQFSFLQIVAQSSGPNSPGSAVNVDAVQPNWSNVNRVFSSNDSRATISSSDFIFFSDFLTATGFGFSIPATDIINGIVVEIEKSRTGNTIGDVVIQLTKDGTNFTGDNKANSLVNWSTAESYSIYGTGSDLWGETWTPAEINNSSFGIGIQIGGFNFFTTSTARVDHIRITVYHSAPLPITLSGLSANVTNRNSVLLEWSTSTEINNDYFSIEKSSDGEHFDFVANVKGSGNSNTTKNYSLEDRKPYYGKSYYRLKQTDFDGNYTYSRIVKVEIKDERQPVLTLFPNPAKGSKFSFRIVGIKKAGKIPLILFNRQGKKIAERTYSANVAGVIEDSWAFESPLPAGLYIIKAGRTLQLSQKLVIQ